MEREKITFDTLPEAISILMDEIADIKRLLLQQEHKSKPTERKLLEIDDACRIIAKSKSTVYFLVQKGLIPCYKIGKRLYFYEEELQEWINCRKKLSIIDMKAEIEAQMQAGIRNKPKRRR